MLFTSISVIVAMAAIVAVYQFNYNVSPPVSPKANATETDVPNQEFIQANFSNPNINSSDHIVASEIRGPDGTSALSYIQATIGASGHLSVEIYWKPEQVGDYDLLLFQILPDNLGRGPITQPVANVPLKVIE